MDIKIIINSLLIILILHIIILNINYTISIGTKIKESFVVKTNEDSINFLTTNNDANDEFKKKLLKYVQQDVPVVETEFENKNLNKIQPSNSFLSNNNEPNFESNVADVSKFYKINFDSLNENELKTTSVELLKKTEECKKVDYVREPTVNPDTWGYKNELPMNGGIMNGIVGFDSLESQFAIYNPNKLNLQIETENKFNNIPHDDLRKPIVYEN